MSSTRRSRFPRKSSPAGKYARLDARTAAFEADQKDRALDYGGIRNMLHKPGSMK